MRGCPAVSLRCLLGVLAQDPRKVGQVPGRGHQGAPATRETGKREGAVEGVRVRREGKERRCQRTRGKKAKDNGLAAGAGRGAGKRLSSRSPSPLVRGRVLCTGPSYCLGLPLGHCQQPDPVTRGRGPGGGGRP